MGLDVIIDEGWRKLMKEMLHSEKSEDALVVGRQENKGGNLVW